MMAVAEHIQLTRRVVLAPLAGAPDNVITITFESGNPYRHYLAWVHITGAGAINVSAQPKYAGENDGTPTAIAAIGTHKVKQVDLEEIRPATRGIHKHPDDAGPPTIMKSELTLTNSGGDPVIASVYMIAAATPGGA
jgi:hypothetical protein